MEWLLLTYNLPSEPSRNRVSVWRQLRRTGAVNFQQSLWVLPDQEQARAYFGDLAREIETLGGQATMLRVSSLTERDEANIRRAFTDARDNEYREIIDKCQDFFAEIDKETRVENFTFAEVEENEEELAKLRAWFDKVCRRDFTGSALRQEVSQLLNRCEGVLSEFCDRAHKEESSPRKVTVARGDGGGMTAP